MEKGLFEDIQVCVLVSNLMSYLATWFTRHVCEFMKVFLFLILDYNGRDSSF